MGFAGSMHASQGAPARAAPDPRAGTPPAPGLLWVVLRWDLASSVGVMPTG